MDSDYGRVLSSRGARHSAERTSGGQEQLIPKLIPDQRLTGEPGRNENHVLLICGGYLAPAHCWSGLYKQR